MIFIACLFLASAVLMFGAGVAGVGCLILHRVDLARKCFLHQVFYFTASCLSLATLWAFA